MVKALNGCGLNNRYWIFSAATTNVFYRMTVYDYHTGTQKIYFNYPGPPAPAHGRDHRQGRLRAHRC